jgi:hypothetical protein
MCDIGRGVRPLNWLAIESIEWQRALLINLRQEVDDALGIPTRHVRAGRRERRRGEIRCKVELNAQ